MSEIIPQDYFQIELQNNYQVIIPLENILEVLSISPSQLCPIPGVNKSILGVVNYQGRLLWIVNLNPPTTNSVKLKLTVIVLKIKQQVLGLLVNKLQGVIDLETKNKLKLEELNLENLLKEK